jgi:hypothetical protein
MATGRQLRNFASSHCERMKAFLQHDVTGLYFQDNNHWVTKTEEALAFRTEQEATEFRDASQAVPSHPVSRLDPALLARLAARAPGGYQVGE